MGLVGETGAVQGAVEEVAGGIPGEHAPGAVGAVRAGRQADDQDARRVVAKTGDGPAPVFLVAVGALALPRDALAVGRQARAQPAGDDLFMEGLPGRCGHVVNFSLNTLQ